jgi:hypothetical protein
MAHGARRPVAGRPARSRTGRSGRRPAADPPPAGRRPAPGRPRPPTRPRPPSAPGHSVLSVPYGPGRSRSKASASAAMS